MTLPANIFLHLMHMRMTDSCHCQIQETAEAQNTTNKKDFHRIFVRYHHITFTNALRICKCPHTSEEVVQEVFMKLWIKSEYLSEIEDIEGYLFMMTRNVTISWLRKQNRYTQALSEYENLLEHQPDLCETYCHGLDEWISEARERLAPRQQMVSNTVRNTLQRSVRSIEEYVKNKMER